jgi:hypothetical protein
VSLWHAFLLASNDLLAVFGISYLYLCLNVHVSFLVCTPDSVYRHSHTGLGSTLMSSSQVAYLQRSYFQIHSYILRIRVSTPF